MLKRFGIIAGGVLVSFVILLILIGVFVPDSDDMSQQAAAPSPTNTPVPPSPTVESCPTELEFAYLDLLGKQMEILGESGIGLGELFSEAGTNIAVVLSDEWRIRAGVHLYAMQSAAEKIDSQDAPASAQSLHSLAESMAYYIGEAVEQYTHGIDNFDAEALNEGNRLVSVAGDLTDLLTEDILTFCE